MSNWKVKTPVSVSGRTDQNLEVIRITKIQLLKSMLQVQIYLNLNSDSATYHMYKYEKYMHLDTVI